VTTGFLLLVSLTMIGAFLGARGPFLSAMTHYHQGQLRALALLMEREATAGRLERNSWFQYATRSAVRFSWMPADAFPGIRSSVVAAYHIFLAPKGQRMADSPQPSTALEKKFHKEISWHIVEAARYASLPVWLLLKVVEAWRPVADAVKWASGLQVERSERTLWGL